MLNPSIIKELLALQNNSEEFVLSLHLLFPYQKQAIEAFMKCVEIENFLDQIPTADFNMLQKFSQDLLDLGVVYNWIMPSLTTWKKAFYSSSHTDLSELLLCLKKQDWNAIRTLKNIPPYYLLLAEHHLGLYADSMKTAKKILEHEPNNSSIFYLLGFAYYQEQNFLEALEALERAAQNNMEAELNILIVSLIEKTRIELEKNIENLPSPYWFSYCEKLIAQEKWENLTKIRSFLAHKLDFPKAFLYYYEALCCADNPKKSIQLLNQALEKEKIHYFYTTRGKLFLSLNKKKEAIKDFQMAIQLNEEDDQARQFLESIKKS